MIIRIILGIMYLFLTLYLGSSFSKKYFKLKGLKSVVSGFICLNFIIAFIAFMLAIIFGSNINFLNTLISVLIVFLSIRELPKIRFKNILKEILRNKIILIFSILIFVIYFFNFSGPFLGYWDTYIAAPSITMAGTQLNFVDINNETLYNYTLLQKIPNDLINKKSYGIISKDQRISSGILMSVPFLFFGIFGFRLFYSFFIVSGFFILYFLVKLITKSKTISLIASALCYMNGYIFSINTLNPNLFGMILLTLIIYLSLLNVKNWFIIGLLFGILGSIRNIAIIFSFGMFFYLITEEKSIKKITIFTLATILGIIPILYWNNFAFGNMFMHSSQYSFFEGYRPEFSHNIFNLKFMFNGLFNFPLNNEIIRTPHYTYPVYIYLFLLLKKTFGLFLVFPILGYFNFYKKNKRNTLFIGLPFIPLFLLLSFQENWEVAKTSFILLCFPQIIIFLSKGLEELKKNWLNPIYHTKLGILIIILVLISTFTISQNYELDQRWYERFPKAAADSYNKYENKIDLDEFKFFQSKETIKELNSQKEFLDKTYLPFLKMPSKNRINISNELKKENINVFVIWKYIYVDIKN